MPKIRSSVKNTYTKSGSVTKTFKKVIKDDESLQGFYPAHKFTTGFKLDNFNHHFDDTNTITTTSKSVNHVFGIESSYKALENKIIHTPSTFDTNNDFIVTKNTSIENYDSVLSKNNFEIQYTPYTDHYLNTNNNKLSNINSSSFDEELYNISDQVSIEIELNFDIPAILQNNKFYTNNYDKHSAGIKFNGTNNENVWKSNNSPVSYFNFKENRWDYIQNPYLALPPVPNIDVDDNLYNTLISKSNIAFSPGYNPYDSNKKINSVGIPCFNSKFPVGDQWYAEDDTLLKMSDYITEDFILEKVVFLCENVSSYCQKNNYTAYDASNNEISSINYHTNNYKYLSNTLNFFILNQKTNGVNPLSFWEGSGILSDKKHINEMFFEKQGGSNTSLNLKSSVVNDYIGERSINKFHYNTDNSSNYIFGLSNTDFTITSKPALREIVTTNNCFIFNNKFSDSDPSSLISKIASDSNYIDTKINISNTTDINFENQSVLIGSDCKVSNSSKLHSTHFIHDEYTQRSARIYSSNYLGDRDLQGNDFGRSHFNKKSTEIDINSTFTDNNNEIIELKNKFYKSPYILKPEDNLIFGVNSYTNGNILPYILMLEKSVKVVLIGRHVVNDKKIINEKQKTHSSKSINKSISSPICDNWDVVPTESVYNGFYDNIYNNEDISTTQTKILDREIYGKTSSKKFGSFNNLIKLFSKDDRIIYDSLMPNIISYYKNSANITGEFDNIRLSYESDSDHLNSNHQWLNSYPFEDRFKVIHAERDINIDLKNLGINKLNIKVDKYFTELECYQYYKKDTKFGVYNSGTIFKNIPGYIETELLSEEPLLDYLEQGKSISTAIPTNIYADIFIGSNNKPYIVKLSGDVFDTNKDIVGENKMPNTVNANEGRLVFYNTNIQSDSDITFNFKNIANPSIVYQKFLPYKVIARLRSTQSISEISSQTPSFNNTYESDWVGVETAYELSNSTSNSNKGYFPYLTNTVNSIYSANDFDSPDVLERANKLFFGFTNIKGKSYRHYPLVRHDGWKYGIYNSKETSLSYNFNWNSYGQFKDKYYGSTNTAIYKNDNEIEWPIVKKFINEFYYPVKNTDSSIKTTYNKDYYSRSNYPFIEDSQNSLSQYYVS